MKGLKTFSSPAENGATHSWFSCVSRHFDVAEALNRLGGNRALFAKLAKSFAKNHESTLAKIGEALEKDEDAQARALIHEIRGIAGNLSAYRVGKTAGELGTAIREGNRSERKKAFDALNKAFMEMAEAAQNLEYVARPSRPGANGSIPAGEDNECGNIIDCLCRLDGLLAGFDIDAESCLEDAWPVLSKLIPDEELSSIAKAIATLDYKTAAEKLGNAAKKAGIDFPTKL